MWKGLLRWCILPSCEGLLSPPPTGSLAFWIRAPGEADATGQRAWGLEARETGVSTQGRQVPLPQHSPTTPSMCKGKKASCEKEGCSTKWGRMVKDDNTLTLRRSACVCVCVRAHVYVYFRTNAWTITGRTVGQGHEKIFLWISLQQAKELGLIYECIPTIYLKICNVCAAWLGKKGAATVKECFCSTLL